MTDTLCMCRTGYNLFGLENTRYSTKEFEPGPTFSKQNFLLKIIY